MPDAGSMIFRSSQSITFLGVKEKRFYGIRLPDFESASQRPDLNT
jgi:hypothetical protein